MVSDLCERKFGKISDFLSRVILAGYLCPNLHFIYTFSHSHHFGNFFDILFIGDSITFYFVTLLPFSKFNFYLLTNFNKVFLTLHPLKAIYFILVFHKWLRVFTKFLICTLKSLTILHIFLFSLKNGISLSLKIKISMAIVFVNICVVFFTQLYWKFFTTQHFFLCFCMYTGCFRKTLQNPCRFWSWNSSM